MAERERVVLFLLECERKYGVSILDDNAEMKFYHFKEEDSYTRNVVSTICIYVKTALKKEMVTREEFRRMFPRTMFFLERAHGKGLVPDGLYKFVRA